MRLYHKSLQNGRIAKSNIPVTRGRLYVQVRCKGCILLRFFTEKLKEIRSVPLIRKVIQISARMFWLGSCPTNFHKIIKNFNWNFASHKYKNNYLLGRHASNGSLHRGDKHLLRHSNVLVTTSGFCGQLEKVYFDTSAGDRICGAKNQLSQPRHISHGRENTEGKNKMSKFTDRTRNIDFRINASDWFVGINNPSSTAARLQCQYLQLQQISSLKGSHLY